MISTQNLSHFEPVEKRSRFIESVGYLDFDEFFVEVGVIQIGSFSKQMKCDIIYQFSLTRSLLPQIFIRTLTLFRRILHTYNCLDIYSGTVGLAAIEMQLSQQALLMTFFITEIIEGIVSAILITDNV